MHTIDIIITAYNWPQALERTLTGLSQQTDTDFKVIIADDGSGPQTGALIQEIAKKSGLPITHCWHEDNGFRRAMILNKAVKASTAKQLIFTDQDAIPHPELVAHHRREFGENTIIVGGYMRLSEAYCENMTLETVRNRSYLEQLTSDRRRTLMWKHAKSIFYNLNPLHNHRPSIMGLNCSIDRQAFIGINGYDLNYEGWGQEDSDLANRLWKRRVRFRSCWHQCLVFHQWHPQHPTKQEKRNHAYYKRPNVPLICERGYAQTEPATILFP